MYYYNWLNNNELLLLGLMLNDPHNLYAGVFYNCTLQYTLGGLLWPWELVFWLWRATYSYCCIPRAPELRPRVVVCWGVACCLICCRARRHIYSCCATMKWSGYHYMLVYKLARQEALFFAPFCRAKNDPPVTKIRLWTSLFFGVYRLRVTTIDRRIR